MVLHFFGKIKNITMLSAGDFVGVHVEDVEA